MCGIKIPLQNLALKMQGGLMREGGRICRTLQYISFATKFLFCWNPWLDKGVIFVFVITQGNITVDELWALYWVIERLTNKTEHDKGHSSLWLNAHTEKKEIYECSCHRLQSTSYLSCRGWRMKQCDFQTFLLYCWAKCSSWCLL